LKISEFSITNLTLILLLLLTDWSVTDYHRYETAHYPQTTVVTVSTIRFPEKSYDR